MRGGVIDATGFLGKTEAKMDHVDKTAPVALTDASLQAWIHMTDGTQDIYYDKGSLAGLALDILIRDATDNAASLDGVMRSLYSSEYKAREGIHAGGVVGRGLARGERREPPGVQRQVRRWPRALPVGPVAREGRMAAPRRHAALPRMGVSFQRDSAGLLVVLVDPASMAMTAGLRPGDVVTSIDGIPVTNPAWENWRQKYAQREDAPMEIRYVRDGRRRRSRRP